MRGLVLLPLVLLFAASPAEAQPSGEGRREAEELARIDAAPTLDAYYAALAEERLLAEETGSVRRLRAQVRRGEALYFSQRFEEAAQVLYEVVRSPRFRDFEDLEDVAGAELLLGGALAELGALRSAKGVLERTLARGLGDASFGPAFRRWVDVALEAGDLPSALTRLLAVELRDGGTLGDAEEGLPEDAANELGYLRGRAAYDAGDDAAAERELEAITRRSRFYANAQYLRGAAAARRGELGTAEARFCSIASTADTERFTFFVDARYFRLKDLAWLGLGRVAHEGRRPGDAFYYYFQVPNDSERVAEALFESAYAMYEGDEPDVALDLLDQLEARHPASPFVAEAALLRGYVHLARCEFAEADALFQEYLGTYGPLAETLDRLLSSDTRQEALEARLLREERREAAGAAEAASDAERTEAERAQLESVDGRLLALLRVEPTFFGLHARIRTLDAEAARAGRLATDLRGLATRLGSSEAPTAAAAREAWRTRRQELEAQAAQARDMLAGLTRQLDTLREGGAEAGALTELERDVRTLGQRLSALEAQLRAAGEPTPEPAEARESEGRVRELLRADARAARTFPRRIAALRLRLVEAANAAALRSLRTLRERVAAGLRRARIGRIDAVMGSKRRIEIQIESLAAGRFPPELVDPLSLQGLLRDDEEYWPFEGELWLDELEATTPREGGEGDLSVAELEDEEAP
ncbi:MAG: hypothetical protein AAF447_17495 [Myxococcota bacterium]